MTEPQTSAAIARLRAAALNQAAGRHVGSDKLIQLGLDALLAGVDTPSLRMLAGLGRREEPEARDLFNAVADELGLSTQIPDDEIAVLWLLTREAAADIVSGKVEPLMGAEIIWKDFADPLDHPPALMPFISAIVAVDDSTQPQRRWPWRRHRHARHLETINAAIIRAARDLLAEPPQMS
jgi:hypothetical protein